MRAEAGFALIETVAAAGLVAIAAGAFIMAVAGFARFGSHAAGPHRAAAIAFAEQNLRLAENSWKYGAPGEAPAGTWQTALPIAVPSEAPTTIPVSVTSALSDVTPAGATLSVTVRYTPDPNHADTGSVTMTGYLTIRAPSPGAKVERPGLIAQPSGAP